MIMNMADNKLLKERVGVSVRSCYPNDTPLTGSAICCCQKADTFKRTSQPKCLLILRLIGATIDSAEVGKM